MCKFDNKSYLIISIFIIEIFSGLTFQYFTIVFEIDMKQRFSSIKQTSIAGTKKNVSKSTKPKFENVIFTGNEFIVFCESGEIYNWCDPYSSNLKYENSLTDTVSSYSPQFSHISISYRLFKLMCILTRNILRQKIDYPLISDILCSSFNNIYKPRYNNNFYLDENYYLWFLETPKPYLLGDNVTKYIVSPRMNHANYSVGFLKNDSSYWVSLLNYGYAPFLSFDTGEISPKEAIKILDNIKQIDLYAYSICGIDKQDNAWVIENLNTIYDEPATKKIVLNNVKAIACGYETIAFIKKDGTLWQMGRIIGQPEEHTLFIAPMEWAQEPVPVSMNEQENILAGRERMRRFLTEDSEGTKSYYHADALSKEKRNYYLTYFQDCFSDEELRKAKQDMKNELLQEYFSKFFDFFTTDLKI